MSKSMKAALLSAFVFPGLGHFYLKRPVHGALLAGAALGSLVLIISTAVDTALQISDKIMRGEIQPDVAAITELLSRQPAQTGPLPLNIAYAVLIIAWLAGIIDSYRAGRTHVDKRDREDKH